MNHGGESIKNMDVSDIIIVYTTFSTERDARQLSNKLLRKRLIACAQIDAPVSSLYWWNGNIEESLEFRLTMKSRKKLWTALEATISRLHPYDVPEIVAIEVSACSADYEKWIEEELG